MKKVLCSLLAVLMIAGAVPVNAIAFELEKVGESIPAEEEVAAPEIEESLNEPQNGEYETMATDSRAKISDAEIAERIKTLENKLLGKYFTANRKTCGYYSGSNHPCNYGGNCSASAIIKNGWFKTEFGICPKSVNNLCVKGDSMTCAAFARMAHWYIFCKNAVEVDYVDWFVSKATFNHTNAKKAKKGDIIVLYGPNDAYHEGILLSVTSSGIKMLECNVNGASEGASKVFNKFTTTYGYLYTSFSIGRATNYVEHSYDNKGYCSHCGKYYEEINKVTSIDGTVSSTGNIYVKPHPYQGESGTYQDKLKAGTYKIVGKIANHYGNTWYKISYGSSKTGWVYPEDHITVNINNTINVELSMNKYTIPKGTSVWANDSSKAYNWYGKVSSSNGISKITSVTFEILNEDGSLTASSNRITKKPNATSYTVKTADDTMKFSSLAVGEYILSLRATDENGKTGSKQVNFTVVDSSSSNVSVKGVSLNYSAVDLDVEETVQLTATITPSNATNKSVTWSSSNTSVATVSSSGVVTAVYPGDAIITVTTKDGGYKDTCAVTVNPTFCTVHFDVGGGYFEYTDVHVPKGASFTIPEEIPVCPGNVFTGWQTTDSAEGEWTKTKPSSGSYETGYKYYTWGYEHNSDYTYLYGDDKDELIEHIKKNSGTFGSYNPKKMRYFHLIESSDKGSSYYPGKSGSNYNYFNVDYISEDGKTGTASIYKTVFYFESKVYKQDAAVTVIYQPGDSIVVDKDITLTAMWEEEPPTITVDSIEIFSGSAAELNVFIENNDATENLSFDLDLIYDKNAFEVTYVETFFPEDGVVTVNGDNIRYEVVNGETGAFSGLFLRVILNAKNIEAKDYNFSIDVNKWVNGFGNVEPKVVDGTIHVLNQTYTVTFDPGKGTGGPEDITVTGNEFTVPTEIPVRENWNFLFWMGQNGKGYYPGNTYSITENLDLVAIFEPGWMPEISVENIKGKPGEAVEILVTVKNNTEIPDRYSFVTAMEPFGDYVSSLIFTPSGKNLPENGIMGKFTFDIPEDAKVGTVYSISMIFDEWIVGGFDMASSEMLKITNGSITVEEPEKATYTVTYDANGGSGAPTAQTKTEGVALTLSSVTPVREGYEFLGWATSSTATKAEYQPGGSYTKDANVTLYAVWEKKEVIPEDAPTIIIGEASGKPGETVEVPVVLKNNPGIASIKLSIDYDSDVLEVVSATISDAYKGIQGATVVENTAKKPILLNWAFMSISGTNVNDEKFATITFRIKDNVEVENTTVSVSYKSGDIFNAALDNVNFYTENGEIKIVKYIPGDINGDGNVNNKDVMTLFYYLSGLDYYVVEAATDVNGDGNVNNKDVMTLFYYLSGLDYEIH
ncbi:MAG: InlB B-repeat-containing protein [Oscillospiraceae bacterium]|nr:InlB B-repeat-containing protein [Oscillospiraceae bacterium]